MGKRMEGRHTAGGVDVSGPCSWDVHPGWWNRDVPSAAMARLTFMSQPPETLIPSPDQPVPDEFDLLCEHCGYSLVGLTTTNRCPECGEEFDPAVLPLARVPWLFRKRLRTLAA